MGRDQHGTNLPAEIKITAVDEDTYKLLFMAKGGGSANKSYLYQKDKAVLNETSMLAFLDAESAPSAPRPVRPTTWRSSSAARRPRISVETAKLASARYLDTLPDEGNRLGRSFATEASRPRCSAHPPHGHRCPVRRRVPAMTCA